MTLSGIGRRVIILIWRGATAALAAALPLDDLTLRAFQSTGFPEIDAYFPSPVERASQHAWRSRVALLYALGIAVVSIALTVIGMAAALWHRAIGSPSSCSPR
jgi:hypothetical protein